MKATRRQGQASYFTPAPETPSAPIPLVVQIACVIAVLATVAVILATT